MSWRAVFWWALVISAIITFFVESVADFRGLTVGATMVCFVAVGIIFAKLDAHVFGIARHARDHFGSRWRELTEVTKPIPERERFNVYQAMQSLKREQKMSDPFGISSENFYVGDDEDDDFVEPGTYYGSGFIEHIRNNCPLKSLQYRTITTNAPRAMRVAENALFFLRTHVGQQNTAFAASLRAGYLTVAANSEEIAHDATELIERKAQEQSIYRGHVLTCKSHKKSGFSIEFVETTPVTREQIVLPSQILEVLDRNVLQVLRHAADLRRSGRNLQHGVLLYGPPGTGKTLAVRYLMRAAKPVTVITVTGRQLRLVRESCRVARFLAPSLVVLEDIDLVATDRAQSRRTMLLHDLLDEMDVACHESPVIFLMTTNRPDVIEHALSLRPGRINQAIHFPLPDDDCRLRLLKHYLVGVDSQDLDLQAMVERSRGTSAAFIEEWVRRTTLFAIDRQATNAEERVRVTAQDADAAIKEIVESGGTLTQKLLGHTLEL